MNQNDKSMWYTPDIGVKTIRTAVPDTGAALLFNNYRRVS